VNRSDRREQIVKAIFWYLALPICNLPYALQEWSGNFSDLGWLFTLLAIAVIFGGLLYVILSGPRSLWKAPLSLVVLPSLYFAQIVLWNGIEWVTDRFVARTETVAVPLIDALHQYRRDHGSPPDYLDELVPKYLGEMPRTAYLGSPPFDYSNRFFASSSVMWWNLTEPPVDKTEFGQTGDVSKLGPVLVLEIGEDCKVESASLESMPSVTKPQRFTKGKWIRERSERFRIAEDLIARIRFQGMGRTEVVSILGPPDAPGWNLWIGNMRYYYEPLEWRDNSGSWEEGSR
jgi:hypothetical protein